MNARSMILTATLLAVCLAPALFADETSALFFVDRAEKAWAEKKTGEAKDYFRKALAEKDGYLPALFGLGRIALAEDDKPAAEGYLRACVRSGVRPDLSKAEKTAAEKAEAAYAEFSPPGCEFTKLVATFEQDMIDVAKKHLAGDVDLARHCLEKVLKLDSEHPRARRMIDSLGLGAELPAEFKRYRIFNGTDLDDWTAANSIWRVEGGRILVTPGAAAFTATHKDRLTGDFALDCELRTTEEVGRVPKCGLLLGFLGFGDYYSLQIEKGYFLFCVRNVKRSTTLVQVDWAKEWPDFDSGRWNRYTVVVTDGVVKVFVNSRELMRHTVTKDRPTDGSVGLFVQMQDFEVRKFDVLK